MAPQQPPAGLRLCCASGQSSAWQAILGNSHPNTYNCLDCLLLQEAVGEPCGSQDIQHPHPDSRIFSCPQGMRRINSLLRTDENNAACSNTDPPLLQTLHTTTGSAPPAMHAVGFPPLAAHPHAAMTSAHMWGMYPSVPPAAATPAPYMGTPMHMQGPMMLVPLASLQKSREPN